MAKQIVNGWWETPDRRRTPTPYIAIVQRVQDCLDGGVAVDDIRAVLPTLRAFTVPSFDFALSRRVSQRAPDSWDVIARRMAEHAAAEETGGPEALSA